MATSQEGNVSFHQIRAAHRHGDGTQAQASDGTGASGNLPKFAADGTLTDSGIAATSAGAQTRVLYFLIANGQTGTDVALVPPAPFAGSVSKCLVYVKASDAVIGLEFTIKQHGVSVFSTNPTVAAGTASGTITAFTNLTSSPLAVAADDLFTIDIISGSSSWIFTAQLES